MVLVVLGSGSIHEGCGGGTREALLSGADEIIMGARQRHGRDLHMKMASARVSPRLNVPPMTIPASQFIC